MLSYFSMFGIALALIGMLIMFGMLSKKLIDDEGVKADLKVFDFLSFMGNIGVAMFVFEGNAVVINVRSETRNINRYPIILITAVSSTIILFIVFASFGYYVYRD